MAERKLDIFDVLKNISTKNVAFYDSLTNDQVNSFQPLVVMRWLSGTFSKQQVYLINELVNPFVFSLHTHKKLLWQLMSTCTAGKTQKYTWKKKLGKVTSNPASVKVVREYFHYSTTQAKKAVGLLQSGDIISMAEELGWQDDEINAVCKELGLPTKRRQAIKRKKLTNLEEFDF